MGRGGEGYKEGTDQLDLLTRGWSPLIRWAVVCATAEGGFLAVLLLLLLRGGEAYVCVQCAYRRM